MLHVFTKMETENDPKFVVSPRMYMRSSFSNEYDFNDEISKEIIEKSNRCKILMPGVIKTFFGITTLDKLCSGAIALLMAYKSPDRIIPFYSAGDNIVQDALDLCKKHPEIELYIYLNREPMTDGNYTFEINGTLYKETDFFYAMIDEDIKIHGYGYEDEGDEDEDWN